MKRCAVCGRPFFKKAAIKDDRTGEISFIDSVFSRHKKFPLCPVHLRIVILDTFINGKSDFYPYFVEDQE